MKKTQVIPQMILASLMMVVFAVPAARAGDSAPAKTAIKPLTNKADQAVERANAKSALPTQAVITTTEGDITVKFFPETAPKTVENFAALASGNAKYKRGDGKTQDKPLYPGTIFHRVIPNFMIQGGDPQGDGTGGPGYQFEDETKPSDSFAKPGVLAMANSGPATNGSQFFITVKPTPWLNGKHTIFGEVTQGMDVVEKIVSAPRGESDRPVKTISIKKITLK